MICLVYGILYVGFIFSEGVFLIIFSNDDDYYVVVVDDDDTDSLALPM